MNKIFSMLFSLIFFANLGATTTIWYMNSRGDNYYPKQNVMEAALVSILGQKKTNDFLAGKIIDLSEAQQNSLTLPSHVTTITNYNPKTGKPSTTSPSMPASTQTQTTSTAIRSTPTVSTATTTRPTPTVAARTTTIARTTRSTPTVAARTTTIARTTRSTPTVAARTTTAKRFTTPERITQARTLNVYNSHKTIKDEKITELESKVKELTNTVLQLRQKLGQ